MAYPMKKETNSSTYRKPKLMKWEIKLTTLGEFFEEYGSYDFDPIGQRPSTQTELYGLPNPTKAQGIIGSIMSGYDSGEIRMRLVVDDDGNILRIEIEAVDGSNRGRFIHAFRKGKFPIHESFPIKALVEKRWNEMPDEAKTFWDNYPIRLVIYQNMTAKEAGQQAKYCNTITVPNAQMLRNFDGETPVAVGVRDLVRAVTDPAAQHSLFPKSIAKNGKLVFDSLDFDNDELEVEQKVAQIFYRYYSQRIHNTIFLGTAGRKQLNDMYADPRLEDQKEVDKILKEVKNHLTYLKAIVTQHNGKLNQGTWTYFSRLFFHLQDEFGKGLKIEDYELFYDDAILAFVAVRNDTEVKHYIEDDKGYRARGSAFRGYLAQTEKNTKITLSVTWALEHFDIQMHVKDLDPTRLFDRDTTRAAWIAQGKKCYITQECVPFDDIVGGHIIAHSNKGRTDPENCRAIEKTINLRQSNLDMEVFKKRYWEKKNR